MTFLLSNLSHAYAMQRACAERGLRATMGLEDLALRIALPHGEETWPGRFLVEVEGRSSYADVLVKGTKGFAGWMPYAMRQWPLAASKSAFKRHALEHGVATPAASRDPQRIGGPFLVKQDRSSFGEGIRGPFLRYDANDPLQQLQDGEYYENFVVGLIAKAWCWGPACAALHLHSPSTVTGDGERSVRQLVEALPNPRGNDWALVGRLAAFCGVQDMDAVLPAGKEVLIEFRYGSRYDPPAFRNQNVLERLQGTPLAEQFQSAARTFAAAIPPQADRGDSLFTLDAMVDKDGEALFLEMNCHPLVHPDLYRTMLASRHSAAQKRKPAEAGLAAPVD